MIRKPLEPGLV